LITVRNATESDVCATRAAKNTRPGDARIAIQDCYRG
jgi:hypothetical protein